MAFETIKVETKGRVGLITLDRPDALNALNTPLNLELGRALDAFEANEEIGCVVITGSDKAFAAPEPTSRKCSPRLTWRPTRRTSFAIGNMSRMHVFP